MPTALLNYVCIMVYVGRQFIKHRTKEEGYLSILGKTMVELPYHSLGLRLSYKIALAQKKSFTRLQV